VALVNSAQRETVSGVVQAPLPLFWGLQDRMIFNSNPPRRSPGGIDRFFEPVCAAGVRGWRNRTAIRYGSIGMESSSVPISP
jgi:hypothetical protein